MLATASLREWWRDYSYCNSWVGPFSAALSVICCDVHVYCIDNVQRETASLSCLMGLKVIGWKR